MKFIQNVEGGGAPKEGGGLSEEESAPAAREPKRNFLRKTRQCTEMSQDKIKK